MRKPPLTGAPGGLLKAKNVRAIQGETVKSDFTPTVVFFCRRMQVEDSADGTTDAAATKGREPRHNLTFDIRPHQP